MRIEITTSTLQLHGAGMSSCAKRAFRKIWHVTVFGLRFDHAINKVVEDVNGSYKMTGYTKSWAQSIARKYSGK